jgi:hypothetical protein
MTGIDTKAAKLRHYLAHDHTYTRYSDLDDVPRGWTFVEHPDGGIGAWRKPPLWALRQSHEEPIRLRTRAGLYQP